MLPLTFLKITAHQDPKLNSKYTGQPLDPLEPVISSPSSCLDL
jgi:hypothetical protein